ncbi:MAG: sodium:alanine symporter family protein [Leptospirales bacterium]|jgi:AGCS family alanine or glycine:cation symporter
MSLEQLHEHLLATVGTLNDWAWGLPLIVLLVGTGVFLTVRLGFLQFTQLGHALYIALIQREKKDGDEPGDITHFQALMTALSATVGTGNIVGVALAIYTGGPGALFWMWVTGIVGMATKYTEAILAVEYRVQDDKGRMSGGPMYYLSRGLAQIGMHWGGVPAALFAVFGTIASFGIGNMTQSNSVAGALQTTFGLDPIITAVALVIFSALVILGGIRSIAKVTQVVVPVMILAYIAASLGILARFAGEIPAAFALIFEQAFSPTAATGGFLGATVAQAIRMGVSRGIFSNESGLGSSPIAAAAAKTKHPVPQALVSMTQTFIDTIIVCTFTGLVIIVTGSWQSGLKGVDMTLNAFQLGLGNSIGAQVVAVALAFFAYSTILGWSYYGERCLAYLGGSRTVLPYRIVFIFLVGVGAVGKIDLVWGLSDLFNALMALPNLIGLLLLSGVAARITKEYLASKASVSGT